VRRRMRLERSDHSWAASNWRKSRRCGRMESKCLPGPVPTLADAAGTDALLLVQAYDRVATGARRTMTVLFVGAMESHSRLRSFCHQCDQPSLVGPSRAR
jgi:hypothetical protein